MVIRSIDYLFKYEDRSKSNYNLLENYDDNYSLCVCPTGSNGILNFKLLSSDEKNILQGKMKRITEQQIEDAALEILQELGYRYLYGPDIAPDGQIH